MSRKGMCACRWWVGLALVLGLAACNLKSGELSPVEATLDTLPRAWFDAPLDGMLLPVAPYEVVFHGASNARVERGELIVDGIPMPALLNPEVGLNLAVFSITWTPPGPGQYTLQARVQGQDGQWSEPARVTVSVAGTPTATATLHPTPSHTPTLTPTPASDTPTPTVTPTLTDVPEQLSFTGSAVPDLFYSGGCAPDALEVTVSVSPADEVANLYLFFRLESQTGGTTAWAEPVMMGNFAPGQFKATLSSQTIPGADSFDSAWLMLQFVAVDSQGGVQGRSEVYAGASLARCGLQFIPRVTLRPGTIPLPRVTTPSPTPKVIK